MSSTSSISSPRTTRGSVAPQHHQSSPTRPHAAPSPTARSVIGEGFTGAGGAGSRFTGVDSRRHAQSRSAKAQERRRTGGMVDRNGIGVARLYPPRTTKSSNAAIAGSADLPCFPAITPTRSPRG